MNKQLHLSLLLFICITSVQAQKLAIPDSILKVIQTKTIVASNQKDTLTFKVVYPENYDETKTYPVLLALSGGNQAAGIVNYCYAAWFKSDYFKNYITIMPVNTTKKNLRSYTKEEIETVYATIKSNFKIDKNKWIIAGSSNGGMAAFNFIAVNPSLFEGAIVMPGNVDDKITVDASWKHLKIVLAYGEKDDSTWVSATQTSKLKLEKSVKNIETFMMLGQGHILPLDYNTDLVYNVYFRKRKK